MTTYNETNRGKLNANKNKKEKNHPDKRGTINVDGLWYWISAWEHAGNNGSFESLAVTIMTQDEVDKMNQYKAEAAAKKAQPQQQQSQQAQPQPQAQQQHAEHNTDGTVRTNQSEPPMDFDDDIPF